MQVRYNISPKALEIRDKDHHKPHIYKSTHEIKLTRSNTLQTQAEEDSLRIQEKQELMFGVFSKNEEIPFFSTSY